MAATEYEIGILCALALEATAVAGFFDEIYEHNFCKAPSDKLSYTTGKIGRHEVVLGHMPGIGKVHAAQSAESLLATFDNLKLVLLVGICGGVPSPTMALGDVVIGKTVVQNDFGRQRPDRFETKKGVEDSLGRQRSEIRAFVRKLESCKAKLSETTRQRLATLLEKPEFQQSRYPGIAADRLFLPDYVHQHHGAANCECAYSIKACEDASTASCEELECDGTKLMPRDLSSRASQGPNIHFGSIASGDMVMRSGEHRNKSAKEHVVIAFEMEGAGIWDALPCVIIKGVCDYADSHKDKHWQRYAAAAAAACTVAAMEEWICRSCKATSTLSPLL
ncbi:purine and uridine phosphorylase [Aspergillus carlsbadensis]|nr:purine and uridine phosphorylase [Aspergillus carlsbadensis]